MPSSELLPIESSMGPQFALQGLQIRGSLFDLSSARGRYGVRINDINNFVEHQHTWYLLRDSSHCCNGTAIVHYVLRHEEYTAGRGRFVRDVYCFRECDVEVFSATRLQHMSWSPLPLTLTTHSTCRFTYRFPRQQDRVYQLLPCLAFYISSALKRQWRKNICGVNKCRRPLP